MADDLEDEVYRWIAERRGGIWRSLFANSFGYGVVWGIAGLLWAGPVGASPFAGAVVGVAVAVVGSAVIVGSTRSAVERFERTRAPKTTFGSLGTLLLIAGLFARLIAAVR